MDRRGFFKAAAGVLGGAAAATPGSVIAQWGGFGYAPPPPPPAQTPDGFIHTRLASNSRQPVGLRLVNLFDISGSVDDKEQAIQIEAMASAIESEDFRNAIFFTGGPQSIAICFADFDDHTTMRIPWVDIRKGDDDKLKLLAHEVRNLKRRSSGSTHQTVALNYSMVALSNCPWPARRSVVDILTDGEDNESGDGSARLKVARHKLALQHGATLNGLITIDRAAEKFEQWSWKNLATEPGFMKADGSALDPGFIKVVATQQTDDGAVVEYHKAMTLGFRRKLILEVAGIELEDLRKVAQTDNAIRQLAAYSPSKPSIV